jgi:hypothetical protein
MEWDGLLQCWAMRPNADSDAYANGYSNLYAYSHGHSDGNVYANSNGYVYPNGYGHGNRDSYGYGHSNSHCNAANTNTTAASDASAAPIKSWSLVRFGNSRMNNSRVPSLALSVYGRRSAQVFPSSCLFARFPTASGKHRQHWLITLIGQKIVKKSIDFFLRSGLKRTFRLQNIVSVF